MKKNVTVGKYKRNGKYVKGYQRKKLKRSGKVRYDKATYKVTVLRDPKTGWIVGTKKQRVK
jgi:hypothetical protein